MGHSLFGLGRVEILKTHFTSFEMRSLRLAFPFQILIHILPANLAVYELFSCSRTIYCRCHEQWLSIIECAQLSGRRYDFPWNFPGKNLELSFPGWENLELPSSGPGHQRESGTFWNCTNWTTMTRFSLLGHSCGKQGRFYCIHRRRVWKMHRNF